MNQLKLIGTAFVLIILIISGCSTTKDGFSYRVFHNTTAKYNGYFYAKESLKEINKTIADNVQEDYDSILPLFVYEVEGMENDVLLQTERIIEKTQKVIALHNMDVAKRSKKKMEHPEMNKWIDNNYLLLGVGYFYKKNYFKAEEFFLYITRKYEDDDVVAQANNWLARIYINKKAYTKAINHLNIAGKNSNIDDEIIAETNMIFADLYLKKNDYKQAVSKLQKAISHIEKKKNRARPTFILAQLNQRLGNSEQAIALYQEVVKLKPDYELVFYSKINQALAFSRRGGSSDDIKETLFKMIKDDKNIEYQDQIYYALAELSLEERDREVGIGYLEKSIQTSVNNQKQKAKSFLRLADLYFDERGYKKAQAYYDSTATNISEEHPRFDYITNMAESLGELVSNLDIIQLQDSLNSYCSLTYEEKYARLKEVRKGLVDEAEDRRLADELDAIAALEAAANEDGGGAGLFWPYNSYLKEVGKSNFDSYWGDRTLEDNWRRSNKAMSFSSEEEEGSEGGEEEYVSNDKYHVPSVEELLESLPCSTREQLYSDSIIAAAYYNNGLIYKEKLDDFDNGIDSWETLVTNYEESEQHPTAYYQLFRSFYKKEKEGYTNFGCVTCSSQYWANIISERYPGSEWDYLVKDPDYLVGRSLIEQQEADEYERIYRLYAGYEYIDVIQQAGVVIDSEPENHLICKYRLLKAQATGYMDGFTGQRENYIAELNNVIKYCPTSEEGIIAAEILAGLNEKRKAEPNKDDGDKAEKTDDADDKEKVNDTPFVYEEMVKHYFAIVVPSKDDLPMSVSDMKIEISDYNKNNHQSSGLKTTSNLFGREFHIILVKTFKNAGEADLYMDAFLASNDGIKDITEAGFQTMLVSKDNYLTIFKERNLEDYIQFYLDFYNQ